MVSLVGAAILYLVTEVIGTMTMVRCSRGRDAGGAQGQRQVGDWRRYLPVSRVVLVAHVHCLAESSDQVAPNDSKWHWRTTGKSANPTWNSVVVRFGCVIKASHDVIEGGWPRQIRRCPDVR